MTRQELEEIWDTARFETDKDFYEWAIQYLLDIIYDMERECRF